MKNVDLHTHSIYSDGVLTPKELVKKAEERGIKCLSLTDHNSIDGVKEAIKAGKKVGVKIIPGVEILSEWGEVLGYFIDIENKELLKLLGKNKRELDNGARQCIKGLQKLGFDISYEEVKKEFPRYPMMCFFVAQILVKKGLLKSIQELFNDYLGKLIKIKYSLLKTKKVIYIIKKAGGVAVLAHPFAESNYQKEFANIPKLIRVGLGGIEIKNGQYKSYDRKIKEKILELAKNYKLVLTSGSDFHGRFVKSSLGDCMCDESVVQSLRR